MKRYLIVLIAVVALALTAEVLIVSFVPPQASASGWKDTVVNVERWVNPNGDRLAAVRPDNWRRDVYFIWLTQECAATVHLGDTWPSNDPACAVNPGH